jgi:hypothetical protein
MAQIGNEHGNSTPFSQTLHIFLRLWHVPSNSRNKKYSMFSTCSHRTFHQMQCVQCVVLWMYIQQSSSSDRHIYCSFLTGRNCWLKLIAISKQIMYLLYSLTWYTLTDAITAYHWKLTQPCRYYGWIWWRCIWLFLWLSLIYEIN